MLFYMTLGDDVTQRSLQLDMDRKFSEMKSCFILTLLCDFSDSSCITESRVHLIQSCPSIKIFWDL